MIPKTIHQFWLGGAIPQKYLDLHQSIVNTNEGWEVILWQEDEINKNICDPETYDLFDGLYAHCVDIIKLHTLKKYGGVVLDMDFQGISSFDPVLEYSAFTAKQPDGLTCNACYGSEKDHPWIDKMLQNERSKWYPPHCGPMMESTMKDLDVELVSGDWFYPYNWNEEPKPHKESTIAIHLWHGTWLK